MNLKLGTVVHTHNSSTGEVRYEDYKFKVTLSYTVSLRLAWAS